ncbi:MAG: MFS transporter [Bacteroidetes bacterium]|nr:MAG: MFS transporter [Bacteroidota bacterium]
MSKSSIYTPQYIVLSVSSLLFTASFTMIIPDLPEYLSSLGGEDYKGWIIALFTLTAGLSRPFSGKLADTIGRLPVMFFGVLMAATASFLYPIMTTVASFLLLRFVHGFSTGFQPTGIMAYVADIIPADRRGEAVGFLGFFNGIGMSLGPTFGGEITRNFSFHITAYCSSVFAIVSILILFGMKETLHKKVKFSFALLKVKSNEWIEPRTFPATIVMALFMFSYGMILIIIPDFSVHLGLENKGLFFTFYTIAGLMVRFFAGKVSDTYGRVSILKVGCLLMILATVCLGFSQNIVQMLISAVIYGVAQGITSSTVMAWTIDLSLPDFKGRAVATVAIALEFGIGMGALVAAKIYSNDAKMFPYAFWSASFFALLATLYLFFVYKKK